jgi:hypothetical protein
MFHSIHIDFGLTSDGIKFCPFSHFSLKALKGSNLLSYKTTTMVVILVSYQLIIACRTIFTHNFFSLNTSDVRPTLNGVGLRNFENNSQTLV